MATLALAGVYGRSDTNVNVCLGVRFHTGVLKNTGTITLQDEKYVTARG